MATYLLNERPVNGFLCGKQCKCKKECKALFVDARQTPCKKKCKSTKGYFPKPNDFNYILDQDKKGGLGTMANDFFNLVKPKPKPPPPTSVRSNIPVYAGLGIAGILLLSTQIKPKRNGRKR